MPERDTGLEAALGHRKDTLTGVQRELSTRERAVGAELQALGACEARLELVKDQMIRALTLGDGEQLDVSTLRQLEHALQAGEAALMKQAERLRAAQEHAAAARSEVVTAHKAVRALEVVLERRAAARAEERHRASLRDADEIAARVQRQRRTGVHV